MVAAPHPDPHSPQARAERRRAAWWALADPRTDMSEPLDEYGEGFLGAGRTARSPRR
ncbi:hypothetical protein [Nonomuraea endophytica]|uniref:Uncharacterized protein n=1 Tax=Nonomuraea endophytica TaxID=714136 RepID=A0A7W8AAB7_9ACTN|nr:hypothetical protein [Nonomuraea endophytica]MBB5081531.1 hypothetical protein [Nonomuraea endophytica]